MFRIQKKEAGSSSGAVARYLESCMAPIHRRHCTLYIEFRFDIDIGLDIGRSVYHFCNIRRASRK